MMAMRMLTVASVAETTAVGGTVVKTPSASAGNIGHMGLILGQEDPLE